MSMAGEGGERAMAFARRAWVIWSAFAAEAVTAGSGRKGQSREMHVRSVAAVLGDVCALDPAQYVRVTPVYRHSEATAPEEHILGEVRDGEWGATTPTPARASARTHPPSPDCAS